jgi:peptidyl-prolyl cis-trans isomerase SurA
MVRRSAFIVAMAALVAASFASVALAQMTSPGIGPPSTDPRSPVLRPGPALAPRASTAPVALDRVVAVVNNEAVTQYDVNEQKRIVVAQMREAKVSPPPPDALERQVLERLVTERAMLQYAKETGIRVDDQTVERTILRIAQENKLSPDDFRKLLEREKIPYAKYR